MDKVEIKKEQEETFVRKYPLREKVINIILDRINEAFSDGYHKNENQRLTDALHAIKELIPPDRFPPTLLFSSSATAGKGIQSAEDFMKIYLGGNLNISTLTPFAIAEMMQAYLSSLQGERVMPSDEEIDRKVADLAAHYHYEECSEHDLERMGLELVKWLRDKLSNPSIADSK